MEVDGLGREDKGSKLRETSVTLYKSTQCHVRTWIWAILFYAHSECGILITFVAIFNIVPFLTVFKLQAHFAPTLLYVDSQKSFSLVFQLET